MADLPGGNVYKVVKMHLKVNQDLNADLMYVDFPSVSHLIKTFLCHVESVCVFSKT